MNQIGRSTSALYSLKNYKVKDLRLLSYEKIEILQVTTQLADSRAVIFMSDHASLLPFDYHLLSYVKDTDDGNCRR